MGFYLPCIVPYRLKGREVLDPETKIPKRPGEPVLPQEWYSTPYPLFVSVPTESKDQTHYLYGGHSGLVWKEEWILRVEVGDGRGTVGKEGGDVGVGDLL